MDPQDRWAVFLALQQHRELTYAQRAAVWYLRVLELPAARTVQLTGTSRVTLWRRLTEAEAALR